MVKDKYVEQIASKIGENETILAAEICQVKIETHKMIKDSLSTSLLKSAISAPFSGNSVLSVYVPASLVAVVTNKSIRFFEYENAATIDAPTQIGELWVELPLDRVGLRVARGILNELEVVDNESSESVMRVNFGVRKGAYEAVILATQQASGNTVQAEKITKKRKSVLGLLYTVIGVVLFILGLFMLLAWVDTKDAGILIMAFVVGGLGGFLYWRGRRRRQKVS